MIGDQHQFGAAVDREHAVELDVAQAVVHPGDGDTEDKTEKNAHIHHGKAQQFSLPGAVIFAVDLGRDVAAELQIRRIGAEEHDKAHHRNQRRFAFFVFGQAVGNADAENQPEIAE